MVTKFTRSHGEQRDKIEIVECPVCETANIALNREPSITCIHCGKQIWIADLPRSLLFKATPMFRAKEFLRTYWAQLLLGALLGVSLAALIVLTKA